MRKIGINAGLGFDLDRCDMLRHIKQAGFDAVFTDWSEGCPLPLWKQTADELGLEMPFVHAPFKGMSKVWEDGTEGDEVMERLKRCIADTAAVGVSMVICHVYIGFPTKHTVNEIGLARWRDLLDYAHAHGVRVAFENTEGDEILKDLLTALHDHPATGFCIDTGHEMCYNRSRDMITPYGDLLIATHLNDNLGICGEHIFWHDDLHLLPGDGIADWEGIANRLKTVGYEGILMFELTVRSKPNHHENDAYLAMGPDAYLQEAHRRAVRFAELFE